MEGLGVGVGLDFVSGYALIGSVRERGELRRVCPCEVEDVVCRDREWEAGGWGGK